MQIIYKHVKVENMDCEQFSQTEAKTASISGELCKKPCRNVGYILPSYNIERKSEKKAVLLLHNMKKIGITTLTKLRSW